jgi:DNA modification methylase
MFQDGGQMKSDPNELGRFPANIIFECTCDNPIVKENDKEPYEYKDNEYEVEGFINNVKPNSPSNYNDTKGGVIHTDPNCPCRILDEQSGELKFSYAINSSRKKEYNNSSYGISGPTADSSKADYGKKGGASRFFYCPKASKKDRNDGCDELEEKGYEVNFKESPKQGSIQKYGMEEALKRLKELKSKNNHPTVKPTDLMAYLVRLVTPKGGTVLDPFMGSGSTGKASVREGFNFIGIEREDEYMEIAKSRIEHEQSKHKHREFFE